MWNFRRKLRQQINMVFPAIEAPCKLNAVSLTPPIHLDLKKKGRLLGLEGRKIDRVPVEKRVATAVRLISLMTSRISRSRWTDATYKDIAT
jgi:hypothetical protein